MRSCKSVNLGVGAEEVFVNSGGIAPVCLFNKILAREELQVPFGACVHPALTGGDMRGSVSLCPSDGSNFLHPKHPLSLDSEFKTALWHCHYAGPPTCGTEVSLPLTPGIAAVPQTVLGALGLWLSTANTGLNSLLTALQVSVYLLGFYIGI